MIKENKKKQNHPKKPFGFSGTPIKKPASKGVKLFWFAVRRTLVALLVLLAFLVGSVYALGVTLANGPSESLRDMLVLSAKQVSSPTS